MKKFRMLGIVFSILMAAGLSSPARADGFLDGTGTKEIIGTIVGAAGGGFLGSRIGHGNGQLAGTAIGTLGGAFLGNQVGRSLDRADELYAARAQNMALQSPAIAAPVSWQNPRSGNAGQFVVTRDGYTQGGEYCREYQNRVSIGGSIQQAYGYACRQPDGQWRIIQ